MIYILKKNGFVIHFLLMFLKIKPGLKTKNVVFVFGI